MNRLVLISASKDFVDGLASELESVKGEYDCKITTFDNSEEGARFLSSTPVDLIIADLPASEIDPRSWVRKLRKARPDAPLLVMIDKDAAHDFKGLKGVWLVRKPAPLGKLAEAAINIAKKEAKAFLKGMNIGNFTQVVTSDGKTCSLTVRSKEGEGTLHFIKGQLYDATCGAKSGRNAAIEILSWQDEVNTELRKLYFVPERTLTDSIDSLIIASVHYADSKPAAAEVADNDVEIVAPEPGEAPSPEAEAGPSEDRGLPEALVKLLPEIEEVLTRQIGPVAPMVLKSCIDRWVATGGADLVDFEGLQECICEEVEDKKACSNLKKEFSRKFAEIHGEVGKQIMGGKEVPFTVSDEQRAALGDLLAVAIGPIAAILTDDLIAKCEGSGGGVEELIALFSEEIADGRDKEAFITSAKKLF
ncbi:MAG: hypothetical protein C0608_00660 [Deltaproteobacteria bacterium]|nr:MAG: hypothetical protein C0608_00660 [Deltaproteobacteria bacterium]